MKMTKKARIERAREIIDRNEFGFPFDEQDLAEFSAITGCEIRYACRAIDPNYITNQRHLVVIAYDWSEPRGWSWRKAIQFGQDDLDRHQRARVNQAMRSSICEQVVEFATTQEKVCYACMTTDSLTVDHVWPPFSHIVSGYISQFGDPAIVEDAGSGFKFADPDEERRWQDYHAVEAKLGMLCQTCNRKKGTKRP